MRWSSDVTPSNNVNHEDHTDKLTLDEDAPGNSFYTTKLMEEGLENILQN